MAEDKDRTAFQMTQVLVNRLQARRVLTVSDPKVFRKLFTFIRDGKVSDEEE